LIWQAVAPELLLPLPPPELLLLVGPIPLELLVFGKPVELLPVLGKPVDDVAVVEPLDVPGQVHVDPAPPGVAIATHMHPGMAGHPTGSHSQKHELVLQMFPGMQVLHCPLQLVPVDDAFVVLVAVVIPDELVLDIVALLTVVVPVITAAVELPVVVPTVDAFVVAADVVIAPPPPLRLQSGFISLHIIGGGVSGTHTLLTHVEPGEHTTPVHDTSSWMGSWRFVLEANDKLRRATRHGMRGLPSSGSE